MLATQSLFLEASVAIRGEAHELRACTEFVRNYLVINKRNPLKVANAEEDTLL